MTEQNFIANIKAIKELSDELVNLARSLPAPTNLTLVALQTRLNAKVAEVQTSAAAQQAVAAAEQAAAAAQQAGAAQQMVAPTQALANFTGALVKATRALVFVGSATVFLTIVQIVLAFVRGGAMNARTFDVTMLAALLAVLTLVVVTVAPATAADDDKGGLVSPTATGGNTRTINTEILSSTSTQRGCR